MKFQATSDTLPKFERVLTEALSRPVTYGFLGFTIIILDLFAGRYLLFPIFFVIPVVLSAWFCTPRLAYLLAVLLPLGRLFTAEFVHHPSPFVYIAGNCMIRISVLCLLAFLVSRSSRQTKQLKERVESLVTVCAWSRTVEYHGEWISFEQYLLRKFGINTSHGISPAEAEKMFGALRKDRSDAKPAEEGVFSQQPAREIRTR